MVPEARLQRTPEGLVPAGEGWFTVNAREATWRHAEDRSAVCEFEGDVEFPQLGINVQVLEPGVAMCRYHWEADQEDFLIVSGEALLIIEGQERPLRTWDFVHCPPGTGHVIIGAGTAPCVVVAVGARQHNDSPDWGGYPIDPVAQRHRTAAAAATSDPEEAYQGLRRRRPTAYRDGWLP